MNRRTMIASLATAALIPTARLLANPEHHSQIHRRRFRHGFVHPCKDKALTETISTLEQASWEAFKTYDLEAWEAIYADDFFEILCDGSFWTKEQLIADIEGRLWTTDYEMSDIVVTRMNETSASIRYIIDVDYHYAGTDPVDDPPADFTTYAFAVSCYAKIRGEWKGCSYQETSTPPADPV